MIQSELTILYHIVKPFFSKKPPTPNDAEAGGTV